MPSSDSSIVSRIREGTQRRMEEKRRKQQAQSEFLEEKLAGKQLGDNMGGGGPSRYMSNILIFLLFVSLPLSERIIDWNVVLLFCALNFGWLIITYFASPSWMNILFNIVCNFFLTRLSSALYDIPDVLASVPPRKSAIYGGCNAVLALLLYAFYVDRDFSLLRSSTTPTSTHKRRRGFGKKSAKHRGADAQEKEDVLDDSEVEAYVKRRELMERVDVALCCMILANFVGGIYFGIIPASALYKSLTAILRVLS